MDAKREALVLARSELTLPRPVGQSRVERHSSPPPVWRNLGRLHRLISDGDRDVHGGCEADIQHLADPLTLVFSRMMGNDAFARALVARAKTALIDAMTVQTRCGAASPRCSGSTRTGSTQKRCVPKSPNRTSMLKT